MARPSYIYIMFISVMHSRSNNIGSNYLCPIIPRLAAAQLITFEGISVNVLELTARFFQGNILRGEMHKDHIVQLM